MDASVRELVRRRADDRCEYCRLRQKHSPFAQFHVEHVRAIKHGGDDDTANLALACPRCNLCKGPNLSGVDPDTHQVVLLFNPRSESWEDHFEFSGPFIRGLTPSGRATVRVLNMNEEERVRLRDQLERYGES